MKRLHPWLLAIFMLAGLNGHAAGIYVSPNGSDKNDGSIQQPLASLSMALHKARELRRTNSPSITNGIHIILRGGYYLLKETIEIRPEDSGTESSPTIIEAATGEFPILSGGVRIINWKKAGNIANLPATAKGKIWEADVPLVNGDKFEFRQLFVNDQKAIRAKSVNGDSMSRIINWDKKNEACIIPTPAVLSLDKTIGTELFIHQWWAIAILRIRKYEILGDSTRIYFYQPESKIQNEHPWPAPWLSKETGNSAFYLTNAIQFLDSPGEWWLDKRNQKIYYWPRAGENLQTAIIIAPALETLIKFAGSADHPVSNIYFKQIAIQHTGWLRPSQAGHVPHQAGMYMTEAYKLRPAGTKENPKLDNQAWIGRPAAAMEISYSNNISIEDCRFEHLASTGLDAVRGVKQQMIIGNLFRDIGGTGILAGTFSDPSQEIHIPWDPKDEAVICDKIQISNNLVTDVTNEDWSCTGIGIGYARNMIIDHNEIENVSYSGLSLGWGWTAKKNAMQNNLVSANKIHHYGKHNYDCSGIYTLSAQPGTVISDNYIDSIYKAPYAHLPSHWFYLYTDEGSSYITVKNNWTPSTKYLQNANGPGNEWTNNGPEVDLKIKNNAGLEKKYSALLIQKTSRDVKTPINKEHDELIEIITAPNENPDPAKLQELLLANKVNTYSIYTWQNHTVIFGSVPDLGVLQQKLRNQFGRAEVKAYQDLFYEYSMQQHCPGKSVAKEWDHIILTADLVPDLKKQAEYLRYHATQFEEWPEIAKGFCNADFQQLLLFRNGRQLMLVISIPKGKTLDELNPKTTENNPRVSEWNKIMGQYQQGIKGAKKGETWVFFKRVKGER